MTSDFKFLGEHQYDGMRMSGVFPVHILDRVKNEFQLRDDDVIVATFPKAGTTWYQEIVWLIMNGVDIEQAGSVLQDLRVPFLEIDKGMVPLDIDILIEARSPRIYKTHLPYRFFDEQLKSKQTKVILGARNIKDTLISTYHFFRMNAAFGLLKAPFNDFFELFRQKQLAYGDWFDYNLDYWNNRGSYNLFVLKYEDLHKDPIQTIKNVAAFLEKDLTDDEAQRIARFCSFGEMKDNVQVNKTKHPGFHHEISPFFRKGKVGEWKNTLTEEQCKYIDDIYKERIEGSGLNFDFDL